MITSQIVELKPDGEPRCWTWCVKKTANSQQGLYTYTETSPIYPGSLLSLYDSLY